MVPSFYLLEESVADVMLERGPPEFGALCASAPDDLEDILVL